MVVKFTPDTFAPKKMRPRPNVPARSAKIGPAEVELRTGIQPTKVNVAPLLVALIGVRATLLPIASWGDKQATGQRASRAVRS